MQKGFCSSAQKLLHDLRLREERVAAAQNSSYSSSISKGIHQKDSQNSKLFKYEQNKSFPPKFTGTRISNVVINDQEATLPSVTHEPLTELERHFKESVIKDQLFVNTAEALFKLNIPISILHASDKNNQGEDIKLMLDCGYEIIKRKAIRQELAVHPYATISIRYTKTSSLKRYYQETLQRFRHIKVLGGNGSMNDECDAANYLHNMIGKDMQNRNSDMNSMWDSGWSTARIAIAWIYPSRLKARDGSQDW